MLARVLTGIVGIALLIGLVFVGYPYFEIAVGILVLFGVREFYSVSRVREVSAIYNVAMTGSLAMYVLFVWQPKYIPLAMYVYVALLFLMYLANRQMANLKDVSKSVFGTFYIVFFFSHLNMILAGSNGVLMIWVVFICAFATDTFAMLGGKILGKRKLCPMLSPKKTIEGAIFGVFGCIFTVFAYCCVCEKFFGATPQYGNVIIISTVASVISQIGDLCASCIKRQYEVKDFGKFFPGHGGVLDRFDSVLFVAPFIYYITMVLPILA